jgi:FADH2 O2-dependent halogenase
MSTPPGTPLYDVIIIGTGFAGTLLGAILARHGVNTLMLDAVAHPRFAIGESTVPHTTLMLELLSRKYDVPEIMNLTSPELITKHVGSSCGVKGNFGYVYHREGQPQNPREIMQLGVSKIFRHDELHFYRQDTDAYMLRVALHYGARARQDVKITDVEIDEGGVRVLCAQGLEFRGKYVVDASGYRSVLAKKMNLRHDPVPLQLQTRTLFTHMVDVRPYDDCVVPPKVHGMPSEWARGTLHHVFPSGWLWVIPFNNHAASTNPLVSVGLTLDLDRNPPRSLPPEVEFAQFLAKYPSIAPQFEKAKPVREWVSTDRLQYSSKKTLGYRYCLMSHASAFVDPFYSRGLVNTMEVINGFVPLVRRALETNDFSEAPFDVLERLQQKLIEYNDRMVHCTYFTFRDFELWNAWNRIWILGVYASEAKLVDAFEKYKKSGDPKFLALFERAPFPGQFFPFEQWYEDLFNRCEAEVHAVMRGEKSPSDAARALFDNYRHARYERCLWSSRLFQPLLWAVCDPETPDIFMRPQTFLRPKTLRLGWKWRQERRQ